MKFLSTFVNHYLQVKYIDDAQDKRSSEKVSNYFYETYSLILNFYLVNAFIFLSSGLSSNQTEIFELFKNSNNEVHIGSLLGAMEKMGIRRTDPRLNNFMRKLLKMHGEMGEENTTLDHLKLDIKSLESLTEGNIVLTETLQKKLIIPDFDHLTTQIREIYENCSSNTSGKVANYIPQLAKYGSENWALSLCSVDGQRFSLGNTASKFTLQSCSKPFTYGICLNELGHEVVHKYVGHEPSGKHFNEICLDAKLKPHNPMLNSGAIMSCGLVLQLIETERKIADKFDYILDYLKKIAGYEEIGFNNAVFLSERDSADRNFAMAYYMRENKCFPPGTNLNECMDFYFQICSMEVDTEALAVMGATLANGGICPTTGERILSPNSVRDVLSLMYSCGMYNHSGEFAFKVGLPAKSGVSGALLLVIPNVMSFALWSPPLDKKGNSVRGVQFAEELVDRYNFHRFDNLRHSEKKEDPRRENFKKIENKVISLLFAASAGDEVAILRYHMQGIDTNSKDYDGRTPLHIAAAEGHTRCVRLLLETCRVDPFPKDRWGFTPSEEARRFGFEEIANFIESYE